MVTYIAAVGAVALTRRALRPVRLRSLEGRHDLPVWAYRAMLALRILR